MIYKIASYGESANGDPFRQQGDYSFLLVVEADKMGSLLKETVQIKVLCSNRSCSIKRLLKLALNTGLTFTGFTSKSFFSKLVKISKMGPKIPENLDFIYLDSYQCLLPNQIGNYV